MKKPEIFISYAWRDREKSPTPDDRESIVEQLCLRLEQEGYTPRLDKTQVGYRKSIDDFMLAIGRGNYVVLVVSNKYLASEYCMYEALKVLEHGDFEKRVFPIVLPDANIYDAEKMLDYKGFWKNKSESFSEKLDAQGRDSGMAEFLLKERDYKAIHESIADIIMRLRGLNTLSAETHLSGKFEAFLEALETQIAENEGHTSQKLTTPVLHAGELPEFPRVDFSLLDIRHALRPTLLRKVLLKFPDSMNLVGERGNGRRRFMKDLADCGLREQGIRPIHLRMPMYLGDFGAFVEEMARQGQIAPGTRPDVADVLRRSARQNGRPILLILEKLEELFAEPPTLDKRYDLGFLRTLNALCDEPWVTLFVASTQSVNHATFQGVTSPLKLEEIRLSDLMYDEIGTEIQRRLPELPEELRQLIQLKLEDDPHKPYTQLDQLLEALHMRPSPSRDWLSEQLRSIRKTLKP